MSETPWTKNGWTTTGTLIEEKRTYVMCGDADWSQTGFVETRNGIVGFYQGKSGTSEDLTLRFCHQGRTHTRHRGDGTFSPRSVVRFAKQFAREVVQSALARARGQR